MKPDPEPSRPSSPKSVKKPKPVKGGTKNKKQPEPKKEPKPEPKKESKPEPKPEPKKPSRPDTTIRMPMNNLAAMAAALEDSDEMSSDSYQIEDVLE